MTEEISSQILITMKSAYRLDPAESFSCNNVSL